MVLVETHDFAVLSGKRDFTVLSGKRGLRFCRENMILQFGKKKRDFMVLQENVIFAVLA